jgi:hypothetical protein
VLGDVCRGPGSGGYRLVLNPGGRLSGHARNLEALNGKSLAGLALEGLGNRSRNWPANALPLQVFDRDGSFEWTGLPRGRWQLVLYVADPVIDVPENPFIRALKPIQVPHRVPLAIVELEEGTSQYLGIDLRDLPSLRRD